MYRYDLMYVLNLNRNVAPALEMLCCVDEVLRFTDIDMLWKFGVSLTALKPRLGGPNVT